MDNWDLIPKLNFNLINARIYIMRAIFSNGSENTVLDLIAARDYIDKEMRDSGQSEYNTSDLRGLARWEAQQ